MKKNILRGTILIVVLVFAVSASVVAAYKSRNLAVANEQPTDSEKAVNTTASPETSAQETSAAASPTTDNGPSIPRDIQSPSESTVNTSGDTTSTAKDNVGSGQNTAAPKVKVKALYLTGWTVGSDKNVEHYIQLAKTTEINSYVIDIKDDDGLVGYESSVPAVRDIKGWEAKYNVDKVIKAFHDNNIHIIGRIVCFKDPVLSSRRTELAIKDSRGGLYKTKNTNGNLITWLNPYEKGSWSYLTDIAKEAVSKGFDEIQFDYVRFANDGPKKYMDFSAYTQPKYEAIDEFLDYAKQQLPGVTLSADIFGIVCESPADTEQIGQNLEYIGKNIDYISPMAYPSHYALGQEVNGVTFAKPDLNPYGVVYNTLIKAKNRISAVDGYKANIRPYLQDFTASWIGKGNYQSYGPEQLKQQIKAVYDAGFDEWILWDANNHYSESGLEKK